MARTATGIAGLLLISMSPAWADEYAMSQATAARLQKFTLAEISTREKNLMEIGRTLSPDERSDILEITGNASDANEAVGAFLTLATIYQRMINAADRKEVRSWLPEALQYAIKSLSLDIAGINNYLGSLTSPAAASEAQKIRDALQQLSQELEKYRY